jgi:hypothetical protein
MAAKRTQWFCVVYKNIFGGAVAAGAFRARRLSRELLGFNPVFVSN